LLSRSVSTNVKCCVTTLDRRGREGIEGSDGGRERDGRNSSGERGGYVVVNITNVCAWYHDSYWLVHTMDWLMERMHHSLSHAFGTLREGNEH